jgi:hypothetical protein
VRNTLTGSPPIAPYSARGYVSEGFSRLTLSRPCTRQV